MQGIPQLPQFYLPFLQPSTMLCARATPSSLSFLAGSVSLPPQVSFRCLERTLLISFCENSQTMSWNSQGPPPPHTPQQRALGSLFPPLWLLEAFLRSLMLCLDGCLHHWPPYLKQQPSSPSRSGVPSPLFSWRWVVGEWAKLHLYL